MTTHTGLSLAWLIAMALVTVPYLHGVAIGADPWAGDAPAQRGRRKTLLWAIPLAALGVVGVLFI